MSAGLSFEISKKDKLLVCGFPKGYLNLINFLGKQHVVLYDVEARCAWLVDGRSAVLHLVRASLEQDVKEFGEDSEDFLYRPGQLQEADEELDGPDAAAAVLRNRRNYLLELSVQEVSYHGEWTEELGGGKPASAPKKEKKYKETYNFFKDRVVEICTSLEKIVDHMSNRDAGDGINFVLRRPRENLLGGFDFMDIASNKDSFSAREMPLRNFDMEEGWTSLTSSIGAITLFGKKFGDLIKPVMLRDMRACNGCGFGAALPAGKDYLAARSRLVASILERSGDGSASPRQLVEGLHWQAPRATFQPCGCTAAAPGQEACRLKDRIQVLYRSRFPRLWSRGTEALDSVEGDGAMVFGHSFLPLSCIRMGVKGRVDEPEERGARTGEDSQYTGSGNSMLASASDSGNAGANTDANTQATSPLSSPTPSSLEIPAGAAAQPGDASGSSLEGKVKVKKPVPERATNLLTLADGRSRKRPLETAEATSSTEDDMATGPGASKRMRVKEFFHLSR